MKDEVCDEEGRYSTYNTFEFRYMGYFSYTCINNNYTYVPTLKNGTVRNDSASTICHYVSTISPGPD